MKASWSIKNLQHLRLTNSTGHSRRNPVAHIQRSWLPSGTLTHLANGDIHVVTSSGTRVARSSCSCSDSNQRQRAIRTFNEHRSCICRRSTYKVQAMYGTAHYCEVMEAAIVGSDTFGRVHSGIPTHRYGGPAALKVEIRQACFQWMCRRSYTSQQAYLMVNEE